MDKNSFVNKRVRNIHSEIVVYKYYEELLGCFHRIHYNK